VDLCEDGPVGGGGKERGGAINEDLRFERFRHCSDHNKDTGIDYAGSKNENG
jgi:hypothetical protein